jgi:hypothetical protein
MDWLPKYELSKCVKRYNGDFHVRTLPCYEQFLILAFAQLSVLSVQSVVRLSLFASFACFVVKIPQPNLNLVLALALLRVSNIRARWLSKEGLGLRLGLRLGFAILLP